MSGDIVGSEVDTKGQHIRQGAAFIRQDNAISAAVLDCYCPASNWKNKHMTSQNDLTN